MYSFGDVTYIVCCDLECYCVSDVILVYVLEFVLLQFKGDIYKSHPHKASIIKGTT